MQTSENGLNVTRSFEGRALRAYQDSVGVWTIGYGSTNYDEYAVAVFGPIKKGLQITETQAEHVFVYSIRNKYEPAVRKRLAPLSNCTQGTFDAGVSFHYNTGAIAKATWPDALIRGDREAARVSILSWNKAKGQVLAGLTRRRKREWAMIDTGDYGPEGSEGPMDLDTRKQLPPPSAPTAASSVPGLLTLGDKTERVAECSSYLAKLGYLPKEQIDAPSLLFSAETEKAVRAYQASHPNLTVDGKIGPATYNSLIRDMNLRESAGKTGKAAAVVGAIGVGAKMAGYATLETALVAAALVGTVGMIYLCISHWTELKTLSNQLRGKQVP